MYVQPNIPPRNYQPNNLPMEVRWSGPRSLFQILPVVHATVLNTIVGRVTNPQIQQNPTVYLIATSFYNLIMENNTVNAHVERMVCHAMSLGVIRHWRNPSIQLNQCLSDAVEIVTSGERNMFAQHALAQAMDNQSYMVVCDGADDYSRTMGEIRDNERAAFQWYDNTGNQSYQQPQHNQPYQNHNNSGYQGYQSSNNGYAVPQPSSSSDLLSSIGGLQSLDSRVSIPDNRVPEPQSPHSGIRDIAGISFATGDAIKVSNEPLAMPTTEKVQPMTLAQEPPKSAPAQSSVQLNPKASWVNVRALPAFTDAHESKPVELYTNHKITSEGVRKHYGKVIMDLSDMASLDDAYPAAQDAARIMVRNVGEALGWLTDATNETPNLVRRRSGWYLRTLQVTQDTYDALYAVRQAAGTAVAYCAGVNAIWEAYGKTDAVKNPTDSMGVALLWLDSFLGDCLSDFIRGELGLPWYAYSFASTYREMADAIRKEYGDAKYQMLEDHANAMIRLLVQPLSSDIENALKDTAEVEPQEGNAVMYIAVPISCTYIPLPSAFFNLNKTRRNQQYTISDETNPGLYAIAASATEMHDPLDEFSPVESYVTFIDGTVIRIHNGLGAESKVVTFYRI